MFPAHLLYDLSYSTIFNFIKTFLIQFLFKKFCKATEIDVASTDVEHQIRQISFISHHFNLHMKTV